MKVSSKEMMSRDEEGSIILENTTNEEWTLLVEPEVTPYNLPKGTPVEIKFTGGKVLDNIKIRIQDNVVHFQEIDKPYAKIITVSIYKQTK